MDRHFQVVIVGGGPVGVALAVELGLRGIACGLVERKLGVGNIPKGQNLTHRTLEHFYFWGIADDLRARRLMPPGYPIGGITAYGSLSSPYWFVPPRREVVAPYYSQANERLPQYEMEKVLRAKMATLPSVTAQMGWSATAITQDADGVAVEVAEEGGDARERWTADYAVGCDGARSLVRSTLGIPSSGSDFDQLMMLAVFRSRALHEALQRFPPASTYLVMNPALKGYWQFFGRIDVGEGFFFHAPVPRSAAKDPDFDFRGLLRQVTGFDFALEFDHVGFWDLRVAVAERYQDRRIFIAGDAAHSHPPYGGFGLNSGLEDVTNLGWKLAATLQGWGSERLLASYGEERRPIFHDTAEDFIAGGIRADAEFLARYSPERDKAEFEAAWEGRKGGLGDRFRSYEPHYEGSPVVLGPPGGKSSAHGVHGFAAKAGHHLPPAPLSSGKTVFEALGPGFTLLAFGVDEGVVKDFAEAARRLTIPLTVVRDSRDGGREAYGAGLILVRPDQYVVWCGDAVPGTAETVLSTAIGRVRRWLP
ncbi:MAG TPA: FAD-dependent monooxygenase [Hyphomicrobiales bacterium]|nr:FAD-dependent monooxygenase [Hyphomicrobiales bacterium]